MDGYRRLTQRVRDIASNLRPPMLSYGLKAAIEDLVDNFADDRDVINILPKIQAADGSQYDPDVEQHLYRIVQQACENAIRHARAQNINISGRLNTKEIELNITDDGIGFHVVLEN